MLCETILNSQVIVKNIIDPGNIESRIPLTPMLLVANLANRKWCKKLKNDWNPGIWVLNHPRVLSECYSMKLTWQGVDDFQESLRSSALDKIVAGLDIGACPIAPGK